MPMRKNTYDCATCLNAQTPLCDICSSVQRPSGQMSKPSFFVDSQGGVKNSQRRDELVRMMSVRIQKGKGIPLAMVMEYNNLIE